MNLPPALSTWFILLYIKINTVTCADDANTGGTCSVESVANAQLGVDAAVGDVLSEGTTYKVYCINGYQLGGTTIINLPCVTGNIPASCREVTIQNTETQYVVGSEVKLTCTIKSEDKVTGVRWTKDDKDFRVLGYFPTDQTSTYRSALTFTAVSVADSGVYKCEATVESIPPYDKELYSSDDIQLNILDTVMAPSDDPVYLMVGEPFPLSCSFPNLVSYSLTITWSMGSSPVTSVYSNDEGATTSSKMVLNAKHYASYSATYTCKGTYRNIDTNAKLTVSDSKRVVIRGIATQPSALTLGVGDEAVFTCAAVGETKGSVAWLVGGTSQDSSLYTASHDPSTRVTRTILTLASVQKQNSMVQCLITYADLLVKSEEVQLAVFGIGIITHPADSGFAKGEDHELSCSVMTEQGVVPTVRWYKRSTLMPSEKYSTNSNTDGTVFTSHLYFYNIQTASNGPYKCRADWVVGGSTTTIESDPANVYVRQVIIVPSDTFTTSTETTDVREFKCFFYGSNEPDDASVQSASWLVEGVDVRGVDNFVIDETTLNKASTWGTTLTMRDISPKLAGPIQCKYQCGVGGPISGKTHLYVHRHVDLPPVTMAASPTYTITCTTETNEPATVTWLRDSKPVTLNDPNFTPQSGTTVDYVQTNTLSVKEWSAAKETVNIVCKYSYDMSSKEYTTSTIFIYKGFTGSPDRYTYYSGDSTTGFSEKVLYCSFGFSYSMSGPTEATWTKDGQSVGAGDSRYETVVDKQTGNWQSSLRIKGTNGAVSVQDSGVYVCSFVFSQDEKYERIADIYFYSISLTPTNAMVYDAKSLTLTCVLVSGTTLVVGQVDWKYSEREMEEPAFKVHTSNGLSTTLTISEVVESNSGTYTCIFNVPGNYKQLKASDALSISNIEMLSDEYIITNMGSLVELTCSVKSWTINVDLAWYKDGTLVSGYTLSDQTETVLFSTLSLTSIQTGNLGEYRCGIGDSRSRGSTSVSVNTINSEGSTVVTGGQASVQCHLVDASGQPTAVYWTDGGGKEYRSTDASNTEYTVTDGMYTSGDQTTTLQLAGVQVTSQFTCHFTVLGHTTNRKVTVTVLDITTTPALVHKGSDATIQCRIAGLSSEPTVTWSGGQPGHTTTAKTGQFAGDVLEAELEIKSVQSDQVYTCTAAVGGKKFIRNVQVEIYELTVPDSYVVLRATQLQIQIQIQPEISDLSSLVKDVSVSQDTTVNGDGGVSGLTITYTSVVGDMVVTYHFTDSTNTLRLLTSTVHVVAFGSSVVSLSEGTAASAVLTCKLSGVLAQDAKSDLSAFWMISGKKTYQTPTVTGNSGVSSTYALEVTGDTEDQKVPCGFTLRGTDYTHTATLDIIDITCTSKVELVDGTATDISCTISGSEHIEPVKAIWYLGNSQQLIQGLTKSGWPGPITTTLSDITTSGSYRCVIDFGVAEFTKTISVFKEDGEEPVDPTEDSGPGDDSNKSLPMILGITISLVLLIIVAAIAGYFYFRKHRTHRASFNIKTLSVSPNSFNRPESLIYTNDPVPERASRYASPDPDIVNLSNNSRVNYRIQNRSQVKGPAPPPPSRGSNQPSPNGRGSTSISRPYCGTDRSDPVLRYNRDFDASVYSRNMVAGKQLGPTQTSNA